MQSISASLDVSVYGGRLVKKSCSAKRAQKASKKSVVKQQV
ncbi:hypothetical protein STRDD12_00747 [Streptococcus sp. DD12]|nr:hypothetical protein STRDD12_00747 [Streptococcus sp. DD12]